MLAQHVNPFLFTTLTSHPSNLSSSFISPSPLAPDLQWYSEMLAQHADQVLGAARGVFAGCPLDLAVRIPGNHWWYNTASHAPELTAGCVRMWRR